MLRPLKIKAIWFYKKIEKNVEKNKKFGAILLAIYVFIAIYLVPIFPHGGSANELTRWATVVSIVERGTFEYSWTEPMIGSIVDSARVGDKLYSNKAPGSAIAGVPFYFVLKQFIGVPDDSNIRISWNVLRIIVSSFPLFLLAFWLWKRNTDSFSIAVLLFATPLFSYSLLYFSHVFTAGLIYFAFRLLFDSDESETKSVFSIFTKYPLFKNLLAGVFCGVAVLSEFPAAIAVFVFAIFIVLDKSPLKNSRLGLFILGGFPSVIFLLAYNNSIFGSPFSFSYGNEAFGEWAEVANQGIFGISYPTPEKIWTSFFSPSRGLFFYAPILVLALIIFYKNRNKEDIRLRVAFWSSVSVLIIMAGHGAPHGGWAMSARYALFVVPLLLDSFLRHKTVEISEFWKALLFCISFLLCALPLLSFPFAPPEFGFPHNDFWRTFLVEENWFTPTLFGGTFLTMLPILIAYFAVIFVTFWSSKNRKHFAYGSLIAITLVSIYIFLPNISFYKDAAFRRSTIAERFFKPANRLESLAAEAKTKQDWQNLQKINSSYWNIADTRAFAPNDYPYLATSVPKNSPTADLRKVLALQKQGRMSEAEKLLQLNKTEFPFAKCEFSTNLAVIYYSTNRKELALNELESVQNMIDKASRSDCTRSQFLLGSLYKEFNRNDDSNRLFNSFLNNTEGTTDKQTNSERQQAKTLLTK
jgi:4-amino-4-deoxy-L-arabinose transferase-like glycosyltransferase